MEKSLHYLTKPSRGTYHLLIVIPIFFGNIPGQKSEKSGILQNSLENSGWFWICYGNVVIFPGQIQKSMELSGIF